METAERQTIGSRIRRARLNKGLSLRELAAEAGTSASTLSAIERGLTRASVDMVHDLAAAMAIHEDVLRLGGDQNSAGAPARIELPEPDGWRRFDDLDVPPAMAGAIVAFVELGYHGSGMRAIADRAGMSVPGVYHHFASKQDLLVAILDLTMSDLEARLQAAMRDAQRDHLGPLDRFARYVEVIALFHASRRDLAFIGASEMRSLDPAHRQRIARRRSRVQARLDAEILECVEAGVAVVDDIKATGRAISTVCTSICQWFRASGKLTPQMVARQYVEFALRLVGAAPLGADASGADSKLVPG